MERTRHYTNYVLFVGYLRAGNFRNSFSFTLKSGLITGSRLCIDHIEFGVAFRGGKQVNAIPMIGQGRPFGFVGNGSSQLRSSGKVHDQTVDEMD
jgi:hypothetical protein